ncbi:STM4013/SEN3800 family hydrolase [Undibacterium sp. Ji42W]|uniref:STM4013/SEN3800 family hydrolase n=1 Tax=Undibacterium sp. Ji42W TaxID=3413039 RepID=UPI003BF27CC0
MHDMNQIVGKSNVLFITLDTLRHDIAEQEFAAGRTPFLASILPSGWEERHAPGSFTYASHCAFFAGFLPTPAKPGVYERLFSLKFAGSETTGTNSYSFDTPDIVSGFSEIGYRTICIGGVGFFKKQNPLSCVLPDLFQESYWQQEFGVTDPDSTRHQVEFAIELLQQKLDQKVFLFMNLSALHQPNCHYLPDAVGDSVASHAAALRYIDSQLPPLFQALNQMRDTFVIISSDHGTTYGEDGYTGHRLGHEKVWTIPYANFHMRKGSLA